MSERTDHMNRNIDLEKLPIADSAAWDSFANRNEDECLDGTRTDLRHDIAEWATLPQKKCIFWLNGMAGTGKSTISRTMARLFQNNGVLGASFFFKKGEADRGNASRFFTTLSRDLVIRKPETLLFIQAAIQHDPDIATKSLSHQFEKLLLHPLQKSRLSRIVIVIDALDECENEQDIRVILRLLPQINQSSIQAQVFVTSRPELPVRLGFEKISPQYEDIILHEIPEPIIEHDISLFMEDKLKTIQEDFGLPPSWPDKKDVQALVQMAIPLFIFAATMCRFIGDDQWDPIEQLTKVLKYQPVRLNSKMGNTTYLPVLDQLLTNQEETEREELVLEFQAVVGPIVLLFQPLSIPALEGLLDIPKSKIHVRLRSLHSVIYIPKELENPVRPFHLSFRDFLLDPQTRKTPFWIDERQTHQTLTTRCLTVCRNLRRNICELSSPGTQRTDIDRRTIDHFLSPELQYACRYWAHHLVKGNDPIVHDAFGFLREHFLHWVEAMSLLGLISEVVQGIDLLLSVLDVSH